ncbi:MAG: glycosyltransferase [Promethearchaeota archaeon]
MKILFIGVFYYSWSLNIREAMAFKTIGHNITCFDCRIRKKITESNLINLYNLKERKVVQTQKKEGKLKSVIYNNFYKRLIKRISKINLPFFKKIKNLNKFYLFGYWKLNRQLINEVKNNNYDLIFFAKAERINYKIIPKLNKYTKTWYFFMDPLINAYKLDAEKYASLCTWSSATFSSVNTFFKRAGANSYFITEGIDPNIFKPPKENGKKKIDVIFIGSKSDKRSRYVNFLRTNKINVVCYGTGWENSQIFVNELVHKYHDSKIILNFTRGKIGFSNRVFMALATKTFLISEFCVDLKKVLRKGVHLEWFRTPEELLNLINYYLKNKEIREKIAYQGYKFVLENFTLEKIMQKIIQIVVKNKGIKKGLS